MVSNAIKFTDNGEIKIISGTETIEDKNYVFVKVTDTGIGINKNNMNIIFREFRQVSEGTTKGWPGTGLGLSITKKYIELLNGKIFVESKEGVGSSFTALFPY